MQTHFAGRPFPSFADRPSRPLHFGCLVTRRRLDVFHCHMDEREHLWRQKFPNGEPEQLTSGGTSEDGVTADPDNRSVITSMGDTQSSLWLHDSNGDRRLASEGEINYSGESLLFSPDGQILYFIRRRNRAPATEICRVQVKSGKIDTIAAGGTIDSFSVSPEGHLLVYESVGANGESGFWLTEIDRGTPPRQISNSGETVPHFGAMVASFFGRSLATPAISNE